jgi:diguanylate cyclase (GGDEF)-like protein
VLCDIRDLTDAAKKVGNGEPLPALNTMHSDEIGQLAQTFSAMEHNLRIDRLTAVFNRESLNAQIGFLQRQAALKPNQQSAFALLFIDLDHFKSINDHYGHSAGDQVLMTVAARLKSAIRISDVVARYGGDEFVVLLKGVQSEADVIAAEDKIRTAVEQPIALEHGVARVGVSLGWAMFPQDGEDAQGLIKIADSRMFDTKKSRKAAR